ncbi:type II toxin-antitoxin system RelE/ParE family toxin [Salinarimonas rosea]|uniref:type II toxin-antitoxin system RelE/ParE family toxin n=1 Tax=Salinarimonas rosea TaxID=552063 RepID=UPI000A02C192|nr:type II toxin-antitoxin system RelE/ParE family toxin [Salinarimonas rosea]
MTVRWTPEAVQDPLDIPNDVSRDNPRAANRLDQTFSRAASRLADRPSLGHAGRVPGTRELFPHPSYRPVYRTDGHVVWIRALVHTARRRPDPQAEGDEPLD